MANLIDRAALTGDETLAEVMSREGDKTPWEGIVRVADAATEKAVRVTLETMEETVAESLQGLMRACRRMWSLYQINGDEDHSVKQLMHAADVALADFARMRAEVQEGK